MTPAPFADAVETADLDELTRWVDRLCAGRDWDALWELRASCQAALERGKQLWPVASNIEYRLALEGDAQYCARVLVDGAGLMAAGPLAEVAASSHRWSELAPHLEAGPVAALVAHERVLRAEVIAETPPYADVLGVPLELQGWEPQYAVALYRPDGGEFETPGVAPHGRAVEAVPSPKILEPDDACQALAELVHVWTAGSEGSARAVAVSGDAIAAVSALCSGSPRCARLDGSEALAWMAWAGASGGHRGRRRGAACGRDLAWDALRALGSATDDDVAPNELGEVADDLRWYWWADDRPTSGWALRLAIEDTDEGLAWAIDAMDRG